MDPLTLVSWVSLAMAIACALAIVVDLVGGHRQRMAIMDVVWPVTALWAGPLGLWAYVRWGRAGSRAASKRAKVAGVEPPNRSQPRAVQIAKAATHCGAGCTLGDLVADTFTIAVPLTVFGQAIFGTWMLDFAVAFVIGIVFQYFTIAPMRHLGVGAGIRQAIKADTASLLAWQVGMYGWMAIATFAIFRHPLAKDAPVFWFMMQIAMFCGFATAYPVNAWLLRIGAKEAM